MASNISDERNELQEDDDKLQAALLEFDNWRDDFSEDEEEDQLLIDLDCVASEETADQAESNRAASFGGSTSQSHSLTVADEESEETIPRPHLELPSQINLREYRADPEMTLHLNKILQGILEEHINDIKEALKENKEKQEKLQNDATECSTKPERKSVYSGSFRSPYFRHANSYPPPNEDVITKKSSGDYDIISMDSYKDHHHFNKMSKQLLKEAVLENYLEQQLKPLMSKMELEIEKRDKRLEEYNGLSYKLDVEMKLLENLQKGEVDGCIKRLIKEENTTIQELQSAMNKKRDLIEKHKMEIKKLETEIQSKREISEDDILKTLDTNKIDWMKIAKQNFGGHSTWLNCQKAWENMVSPAINNKPWTAEDNKHLLALIKSTNFDWAEVAKSMKNGRTPFQCFSHYQQHLNPDLKPRPWTPPEDSRLIRVTNNVKDSIGFFSWAKVSTMMDSRSPIECMYRFTKVDPSQHRGRWTELEDAKLLAAVEMIGPCWSKVAKLINTRNMVQCRDRYLNCLAPNINFSHFTYDEDVKLLKLYKKYNGAWAKMVPDFCGRTDNMLLSRYRQLQKWKQQSEWFDRQSDATKNMLLGKSLTVAERRKFQATAFGYMKDQLGIVSEDYKRQELDRQNQVDPDVIPARPPRHLRCYTVGPGKSGSLRKWSMKLDIHKRLTDNLHRLLEKEALAINAKKNQQNKGAPPTLPAEVAEEIMDKTVEETLKNNSQTKTALHSKMQIKKLEAALNKVFLTEGTISVQELLKTSIADKKRGKKFELSSVIEAELRNLLRRRGRSYTKSGRSRKFFEKDTRPAIAIEEELDELDNAVPLVLIKSLGGNIHFLCSSVRLECLQAQEQLLNLPTYDEDDDFKLEEAETQDAILKLLMRTDLEDQIKQKKLKILNRKLKLLRRIFRQKISLDSSGVENNLNSFIDDLEYLENLIDESRKMDINANFLQMMCSPHGDANAEFDADLIQHTSKQSTFLSISPSSTSTFPSSTSTFIAPFIANTNVAAMSASSKATPATQNSCNACKSSSNEDKPSTSSYFAVPLLPPGKKRTRFASNQPSYSDYEPSKKRFQALSKQEIANEIRQLKGMTKEMYTSLPFLPPNLSTLLGLRALLLKKKELIEKAGNLYKPNLYNRTIRNETVTNNQVAEAKNFQPVNGFEDVVEDSGFWFNSDLEQTKQVRSSLTCMKSHKRLGDVAQRDQAFAVIRESTLHSQSNTNDQLSFENDAFVYPLEERGGHLPNLGSKVDHSHETDAASLANEQKKLPVMFFEEEDSKYKVVIDFAGPKAAKLSFDKSTEKKQQLKLKTKNTNIIPIVQDVSFLHDRKVLSLSPTIKENPGTYITNYSKVIQISDTSSNSSPKVQDSVSFLHDRNVIPLSLTVKDSPDTRTTNYSNLIQISDTPSNSSSIVQDVSFLHDRNVIPLSPVDKENPDINKTNYSNIQINNVPNYSKATAHFDNSNMFDMSSISLHPIGPSGDSIEGESDEDLIATLKFDEDFYEDNRGQNIVNICRSSNQDNTVSKLNTDKQILLFSDDVKESQIYLVSQEKSSQERSKSPNLSNFELPENRVRSIMSNKILKNHSEKIVLVDVDKESKTIVHYKSQENKFTACSAIPLNIAETYSRQPKQIIITPEPKKIVKPTAECIKAIRQTDEYKLALARFKSLFLWPVLMSTFKPSSVQETPLSKDNQNNTSSQTPDKKKKLKRFKTKQSTAKREHLRTIREASLLARRKKRNNRLAAMQSKHKGEENLEVQSKAKKNIDTSEIKDENVDGTPQASDVISDGNGESSTAADNNRESEPRKRKGRPKGSKNKIYIAKDPAERPKRTVRNVQTVTLHPLDTCVKEPVKSLPQWWKDAVLAAMLAKKAMADDGESDHEVSLQDDKDFMDTGNYSDDEWYQEMKQQETIEATQVKMEQISQSDQEIVDT